MQVIPTLCATGSIVGAAGVGYVFGLPAGDSPPSTPHSSTSVAIPMNDAAHTHPAGAPRSKSSLTSAPLTRPSTAPSSHGNGSLQASQLRHRKRGQKWDLVSAIDEDPAAREPVTPDSDPTSHLGKTDTNGPVRRPSSNFLKRLSSISFSATSSPASSERGGSQLLTDSSVSTAQLLSGVPIGARLPRNKLVKSSVSQSTRSVSSGPSLRRRHTVVGRPATTHKRFAALSYEGDSSSHEGPFSKARGISGKTDEKMPSYFSATLPRRAAPYETRSNSTTPDRYGTRRILPDRGRGPVLCQPTSVASTHAQGDAVLHTSAANAAHGAYHVPSSSSLHAKPVHLPFSSGLVGSDRKRKPRRSFSFSSFSNVRASTGNASQRISPRISSAPTVSKFNVIGSGLLQRGFEDEISSAQSNHPSLAASSTGEPEDSPLSRRARKPNNIPLLQHTPPSNVSLSSRSRHSAAFSDLASSHPESESDGKVFSSADEDEARSDTAYDSMRTGADKSTSSYRGPALETLFDRDSSSGYNRDHLDGDTPQRASKGGFYTSPIVTKNPVVNEEESSTSTPGRTTIGPDRRESRHSSDRDGSTELPSSPPSEPKALNLGRLAWDSDVDEGSVVWSEPGDQEEPLKAVDSIGSVRRKLEFIVPQDSNTEYDPRSSLFDWSEPATVDRSLNDSPPPRPKTVHGKKHPEVTGALSGARRAPSGLHMRSQSVPVLADLVKSRSTITSKFGTWGVGSKGVTEDWNEDFDFDDKPSNKLQSTPAGTRSGVDQAFAMVVPEMIKAQQTSVLANIGLLKEWGMLIEELKELRSRALVLDIETDDFAEVFDEVDAMIDLADQEVNDDGLPTHRTSTSSPGFLMDDGVASSSSPLGITPSLQNLDRDDGAAAVQTTPRQARTSHQSTPNSDYFRSRTRPRKDSEAIAQSVIEALQQRRHPTSATTPDRSNGKKIPFDTRTLRKIVPHVNGLVKKVKQIIREAEGLHWSPNVSVHSPSTSLRDAFFATGMGGLAEQQGTGESGLLLQRNVASTSY